MGMKFGWEEASRASNRVSYAIAQPSTLGGISPKRIHVSSKTLSLAEPINLKR